MTNTCTRILVCRSVRIADSKVSHEGLDAALKPVSNQVKADPSDLYQLREAYSCLHLLSRRAAGIREDFPASTHATCLDMVHPSHKGVLLLYKMIVRRSFDHSDGMLPSTSAYSLAFLAYSRYSRMEDSRSFLSQTFRTIKANELT